jgi:dipeptidyl aminopeptidase/acylaminoacyl peptidase
MNFAYRRTSPFQHLAPWILPALLVLAGPAFAAADAAPAATPAPPPAATPPAAPAGPPPALDLFFENSVLSDAKISPDGLQVALRIGGKDKSRILVVVNIATLQSTPVAAIKDQDINDFQWVSPHRLVFDVVPKLVGPGYRESANGLFGVNDDGTGYRKLVETFLKGFVTGQPDGGREPLPWNTWLIDVASPPDDGTVFAAQPSQVSQKEGIDYVHLLRINTVSGRDEEIEVPLHSQHFVVDHAGTVRAVTTVEKNIVRVLVREAAGGWKKLDEYDAFSSGGFAPLHIDAEGRLFLSGAKQRNTEALYVYDTVQGKLADKPILASDEFDVQPQLLTSQDHVLGIRYETDSWSTVWLDPGMKALQARLDKRLPGRVNSIQLPRSALPETVLVKSYADRLPASWVLYDSKADKTILLGTSNPGIDPRQMGKSYYLHYKARDGRDIPAYVTFPPGRGRKALPLIVFVHGGPFVRGATWGWDPEVQFLASRGYAVLQPEYRGSMGFGTEHFRAGWRQYGQAMQDDIADGARWAISEGMADPKRICIMGASYGGYATLMGLAKDADLYRCGVAWAAVTDLRLLGSWAWGNSNEIYKKYGLPLLVGDEVKDAGMLRDNSPVENAGRIRAPLLLAHGSYDSRVPIVHGERMRDLLAGHPGFEWIRYDEEPHGWIHAQTRLDFWSHVEKFLATQLNPQGETQ